LCQTQHPGREVIVQLGQRGFLPGPQPDQERTLLLLTETSWLGHLDSEAT
jgi:hypothetical protein